MSKKNLDKTILMPGILDEIKKEKRNLKRVEKRTRFQRNRKRKV